MNSIRRSLCSAFAQGPRSRKSTSHFAAGGTAEVDGATDSAGARGLFKALSANAPKMQVAKNSRGRRIAARCRMRNSLSLQLGGSECCRPVRPNGCAKWLARSNANPVPSGSTTPRSRSERQRVPNQGFKGTARSSSVVRVSRVRGHCRLDRRHKSQALVAAHKVAAAHESSATTIRWRSFPTRGCSPSRRVNQ